MSRTRSKLVAAQIKSDPVANCSGTGGGGGGAVTTYSLLRSAVSSANLNSDKREALRDFKSALELLSNAQFWSVCILGLNEA